jgi:hypothetical protein
MPYRIINSISSTPKIREKRQNHPNYACHNHRFLEIFTDSYSNKWNGWLLKRNGGKKKRLVSYKLKVFCNFVVCSKNWDNGV